MSTDRFVVGDTATITLTFAGDPGTVSLEVTEPDGTATTYTYATGGLTRVTDGTDRLYSLGLTLDAAGVWSYIGTGTGAYADTQDGTITVFPTAPPSPVLYCTLDELKTVKGIPDTGDDMILQMAVEAASQQIEQHCGQRFWPDTTATARTFVPDNAYTLCLAPDPVASTTGLIVKLDVDDTGTYETTLTIDTDFILEPRNAAVFVPARPFTELVMTGRAYWFPRSLYRRALVQITAHWGWPAIPTAVRQACVVQAAQLVKAPAATFGVVQLGELGAPMTMRSALHPQAAGLLGPFTKPAVG